jgi:hypothetical protein
MMSSLRLGRLEVLIAGAHVTLAGRIDDASPLGELAAKIPAGDVVIDCGGITFVNSFGMREWLRLVRALSDRGTVTLERVADVLMTQMNLFSEFRDRVRVTSFRAQYFCLGCGAESAPLIDAVAHAERLATMHVPRLPCEECGAPMELADFPERYLLLFGAT